MHERNAFITLTYAPQHLPAKRTLYYPHFQAFMRRYRKYLRRHKLPPIRFYMCGEYGEKEGRPHYHACIFGHDFDDKLLWKNKRGVKLYTSKVLTALWGKGWATIGEVNFLSAAYVARYIMKKTLGQQAKERYAEKINTETGEIITQTPEFTRMSLKPGVAKPWFDKFHNDIGDDGKITVNHRRQRIPRFYERSLKKLNTEKTKKIAWHKEEEAWAYRAEATPERLAARERVKKAALDKLLREIE